jgi:hypothetical protein
MTSSDSDSVVLRLSWQAAATIGILPAVLIVLLALVFDESLGQAVVFSVVFAGVFALVSQRRTVELTRADAIANDAWRHRSIARAEVVGVARGQWWNGGALLSTGGRDFWLSVGDQPFGRVSDQRLAVLTDWAAKD